MGAVTARFPLERTIRVALVALAAVLLVLPAASRSAQPGRIVAVGDLHGD
jgi:hypothetical protein